MTSTPNQSPVLEKLKDSFCEHYSTGHEILYDDDHPDQIEAMHVAFSQARAQLKRYNVFGGKPVYLLRDVMDYGTTIPMFKILLLASTKELEAEIEHLGSSPVDVLYPQEVLGICHEVDKLLLEFCNRAISDYKGTGCEALSDLQDDALNAFEDAFARYAEAAYDEPDNVEIEEYREISAQLRGAKELLQMVYKRLEKGDRPSRPLAMTADQWTAMENIVSAVEQDQKELQKVVNSQLVNEHFQAQIEACNECTFALVALFNLRNFAG